MANKGVRGSLPGKPSTNDFVAGTADGNIQHAVQPKCNNPQLVDLPGGFVKGPNQVKAKKLGPDWSAETG